MSAEQRLRGATQATARRDLKRLFDLYAKQRARFATQLEVEVVRLGGLPKTSAGKATEPPTARRPHRVDECSIVAECAHMEDELVKRYQQALNTGLPSPLHAIVQRQNAALVAARDRIHDVQSRSRTVA
jgi:uncharacterized protein (TIGR02284 family)